MDILVGHPTTRCVNTGLPEEVHVHMSAVSNQLSVAAAAGIARCMDSQWFKL